MYGSFFVEFYSLYLAYPFWQVETNIVPLSRVLATTSRKLLEEISRKKFAFPQNLEFAEKQEAEP